MKIEEKNIELRLGSYIVSKVKSLPTEFNLIGKKVDYYKRYISQRLIFKTKEQIDDLLEIKFFVSLKRDGYFSGFYFNKKNRTIQSFFINSPTHRLYLGLPICRDLETCLIYNGIEQCLLVGEMIASSLTPPNFDKRSRVYHLDYYTRSPKRKEDLKRIGFKVFDIIELNNENWLERDIDKRVEKLNMLFPNKIKGRVSKVQRRILTKSEIKEYLNDVIKKGMEGIIVQTNDTGYKIKDSTTIDVAIIGFNTLYNKIDDNQVYTPLRH